MANIESITVDGKRVNSLNLKNDFVVTKAQIDEALGEVDQEVDAVEDIARGADEKAEIALTAWTKALSSVDVTDMNVLTQMKSVLSQMITMFGGRVRKTAMIRFSVKDDELAGGRCQVGMNVAPADPARRVEAVWGE